MAYDDYDYYADLNRRVSRRRKQRRRRAFFRFLRKLLVLGLCLFVLGKVFLWIAPSIGFVDLFSDSTYEQAEEEESQAEDLFFLENDDAPKEDQAPGADPEPSTESFPDSDLIYDIPGETERYYYQQLDDALRKDYDKLLQGLLTMDSKILVTAKTEDLHRLFALVLADHPEIFWVETSYEFVDYHITVELRPKYTCSREDREKRRAQIEESTKEIRQQLSLPASDYEKVRAVYDYLVETVDYDLNSPDNQNIYSALVNHTSVCAGYARSAQYLLQGCGIPTFYVTGTILDGGDHGWNIVQVNGKYYHLDPTYGDPTFQDKNGASGKSSLPPELTVDYAYLCCDDEMIYRDRRVDKDLPIPKCTSTDLGYYRLQGLYYEDYNKQLRKDICRRIAEGDHSFQLQLATREGFDDMIEALGDGAFGDWILDNRTGIREIYTYYYYNEQAYVVKLWYEEK